MKNILILFILLLLSGCITLRYPDDISYNINDKMKDKYIKKILTNNLSLSAEDLLKDIPEANIKMVWYF